MLTYVAGKACLTNKVIFYSPLWNFIINLVVFIKMKHLECVKYEITKVLIHIDGENATIKAINCAPAIHDLEISYINITALALGTANTVKNH